MAHRTAAKQIIAAINYATISMQFNHHLKAVVDIGDRLGHQINRPLPCMRSFSNTEVGKGERINVYTECALSWSLLLHIRWKSLQLPSNGNNPNQLPIKFLAATWKLLFYLVTIWWSSSNRCHGRPLLLELSIGNKATDYGSHTKKNSLWGGARNTAEKRKVQRVGASAPTTANGKMISYECTSVVAVAHFGREENTHTHSHIRSNYANSVEDLLISIWCHPGI